MSCSNTSLNMLKTCSDKMRCSWRNSFPQERRRKEWKVIPVKCSRRLLVTVMGMFLSCSVGFGAILDVDGTVTPADYDEHFIDVDIGGEDFAGTGCDIEAVHWGLAGDVTGIWYTLGMSVIAPPINTTGDGTSSFTRSTTVYLSLIQGGVEQYSFEVRMRAGAVTGVNMWDVPAGTEVPLNADPLNPPTDLKYAVADGLEIAVKNTKFTNLSPSSPFSFDLLFEGGGRNEDDEIRGTVPEPATMSMLVIGGLFMLVRRRRKRQAV